MSVYKEALGRIDSQQVQVLDLLIERGDKGVLNHELSKVAMSYQRRIHELVEEGYTIEVTHEGNREYRYTLVDSDMPTQPKRIPILDQIIQEINTNYNGSIDAVELLDISEKLGANISYRGIATAKKGVSA